MEPLDKNFTILRSPIFIILGALLIQDGLYMLKKKIYPPPTIKKFNSLFHINSDINLTVQNNNDQKSCERWMTLEGYKYFLSGIFLIVFCTWLLFYALNL